jgi:crotonobetainyl-CoA:carnitine CoA-transferase CaiB-like acyl-CoA transferase
MTTPYQALAHLLHLAQRAPVTDDNMTITGQDPVLPTNYLLGTAGAAVIAATGVAAADLWHLHSRRRQRVAVDLRTAAAALRSDRYCRVNGVPPADPGSPIHGFYQTRDSRWVQLHCNFPHHRDGVLKLLGCANDRDAVAKAIATSWDGLALEDALTDAQLCAGLVRSRDEWMAHPQAQAVATLPLFDIIKIADSPPEPLSAGERPLSDIRVLDLTHVIAGPVGGRTLAEHGADVLRLTAPHRPVQERLLVDTGHGKRSAYLDLQRAKDVEQLRTLVRQADVFSQGYRPHALAARGFSPEALAALRPGIVYVTLSAYSHVGPWQHKRGFDSLVQSVSGMVHDESKAATPRHLPAQALDYCSGYLMAFGAMMALARRAREGGSYLVRVSLCQTGHWIDTLGRLPDDIDGKRHPMPRYDDLQDLMVDSDSPFGTIRHVAPAVTLSETPARWTCPTAPFGAHEPIWPA